MKFYPKKKVIIVCLLFMALFSRLSYWQWTRHQKKVVLIEALENRLRAKPVPFSEISSAKDFSSYIFQRVVVSGSFDFDHEIILRNRRHQGEPGTFVLTPLHTPEGVTVIVNRGFVPLKLSDPESRKKISRPTNYSFVGLVKSSQEKKFLAPRDPPVGKGKPWVSDWLRPDIESISRQLPYPILPIFLEIAGEDPSEDIEKRIILQRSDKAELFMPSERIYSMVAGNTDFIPENYPIPVFDPVVPAGRHLGYVFEWGALAIATLLIGIIIQLRPGKMYSSVMGVVLLVFIFIFSGCGILSPKEEGLAPVLMKTSYYGGNKYLDEKKPPPAKYLIIEILQQHIRLFLSEQC